MDRFHSDSEKIQRATTLDQRDGSHYATAPGPPPRGLRESVAERYFGRTDVVGEQLTVVGQEASGPWR